MDQHRFDAISRALGRGATRRQGVAAALGVLLGGAVTAAAKNGDPFAEGPCGNGSAKDNRCKKSGDCCTKYCADGACRCKPNWMECSKAGHCCSGACLNGRCDGGARPAGSVCEENFNCDSGLACIKGICTQSKTASCTKQNCPGCCQGTTCRAGSTKPFCGKKGAACASCASGQTCADGVCKAGGPTPPPGPTPTPTPTPPNWVYNSELGVYQILDHKIWNAAGVFVAPDGLTAWVADNGGHNVSIWSRSDKASTTWTHAAEIDLGGATYPTGVYVSPDLLTAWVSYQYAGKVALWTRSDTTSTSWSQSTFFGTPGSSDSNLSTPRGIFVSADTLTAWIADSGNNRITIWSRLNTSTTIWSYTAQFGTSGSGDNNFNTPTGVVVSVDGLTAWVADSLNNRIVIWNRPDTNSTVWTYSAQFGVEGTGDDELKVPMGVFVSSDMLTAWVADQDNNRVVIWNRPDTSSTTWTYSDKFGSNPSNIDPNKAIGAPQAVYVVDADGLTAWVAEGSKQRVGVWKHI